MSSPAPAFVQGGNTQVVSGTTASLAFPGANTAGNLIVAYVMWDNTGTVTVSDTKGNTYTAGTARQTWGTNWSSQVFYASNIAGGSNTVKATFATALTSFGIVYAARVLRSRHGVPPRRQCVGDRHGGVDEQRSGEHHLGQRPPLRRRCIRQHRHHPGDRLYRASDGLRATSPRIASLRPRGPMPGPPPRTAPPGSCSSSPSGPPDRGAPRSRACSLPSVRADDDATHRISTSPHRISST